MTSVQDPPTRLRADRARPVVPVVAPVVPALVAGRVTHVRNRPFRRAFEHRVHQWLVDLDAVPQPARPWRWLASFSPADHLGDPASSIRANLETFTASEGVDVRDCRVLMLANARVLGYVFDPLTVHWCLAPDGSVRCVVAEVRNTYGERHCYLMRPDEHGRAETDKAFYVSPFVSVDGRYTMRFQLTPSRVAVSVVLHQDGSPIFTATTVGAPQRATRRALLAATLRRPLMPQRVTALIHLHGVWLWLRRLPVVPRRPHDTQPTVARPGPSRRPAPDQTTNHQTTNHLTDEDAR